MDPPDTFVYDRLALFGPGFRSPGLGWWLVGAGLGL
jgi:hypothetical protein